VEAKEGSRKAFVFWIASSKNQCRLLLGAKVYKTVLTDKLKLLTTTTVHRPAALRQKGKIAYRTVKGCDVTYFYIAFSRGPSQRPLCAVHVSQTHTDLSSPKTERILCSIDKEIAV
jgi:hypothetical protein